jgi:hypothetical protein
LLPALYNNLTLERCSACYSSGFRPLNPITTERKIRLLKIIKQRYSRLSHIKTTAFYKTNVGAGFRICFAWFFTELSRSIEPAKNNNLLQNETGVFYPLKSAVCTIFTHEKGDNN